MAIRQLRPGERIPPGQPKRYRSGEGYIRLRWKTGPYEYVETYEHRVDGDRVTTAPQVHHEDRRRDNNSPTNLHRMTTREHGLEHRSVNRDEVVRLYREGHTQPEIGRQLGCNNGTVSRILASEGVPVRTRSETLQTPAESAVRSAHARSTSAAEVSLLLGLSRSRAGALLRKYGLSYAVGRHPAR